MTSKATAQRQLFKCSRKGPISITNTLIPSFLLTHLL